MSLDCPFVKTWRDLQQILNF